MQNILKDKFEEKLMGTMCQDVEMITSSVILHMGKYDSANKKSLLSQLTG
jgi:hypothetical protein